MPRDDDDDFLEDEDDELDDDLDDDEDDDLDDELDDDVDLSDDEVTREDAIAYGHHLEAENAKEKKRADKAEAENRILKRAMAKAKAKPEDAVDRDYRATGRDPDQPFRI